MNVLSNKGLHQIYFKIKEIDCLSYKNSKISTKFKLLQDFSVILTITIRDELEN